MQEMMDVLGTLRDTDTHGAADADTVAADVARGRRALNGRRRRIAGAGVVAAAAVTALTMGAAGQFGQSGKTAPSVTAQQSTPSTQTTQLQLTSYTGAQPVGFKVATVPAGWRVVSSSEYEFLAVPPGTANPVGPRGAVRLDGGIAVMLQGDSHFPADATITKVTINGKEGQLGLTEDKGAKWLIFSDASGKKVLVQVPVKLGLTDDQIVRFAQGITVTSDAHASVG